MFSLSSKDLPTVAKVDIHQYSGQWYEIARFPNRFERGLVCVTANYKVKENGKIEVINSGHRSDNIQKINAAKGTAWVPDDRFPGRLKVRFFWPFSGKYYIIALDRNYQYALVGDPSRKYLWILSRTKILSEDSYSKLLEIARENGFDTKKLIKINQDCNP
ncbi:MAG: lipocalin family protein [Bacteroidales bacterium]|nr:lipocalin family protein [Bacteroidales bacterium]